MNPSKETLDILPCSPVSTKDRYELYLQSIHWFSLRQSAIAKYGRQCELCGAFHTYPHVHHINYRNLTDVTIDDLMILCEFCHSEVHKYLKTHKKQRLYTRDDIFYLGQFIPKSPKKQIKVVKNVMFYSCHKAHRRNRPHSSHKKSKEKTLKHLRKMQKTYWTFARHKQILSLIKGCRLDILDKTQHRLW